MPLRFFLDHCVPNSVGDSLLACGHEIFRLREQLPTHSPDPVVIAKAQDLEAILLSFNGDFADLVSYPPQQFRGIIALQVRNHPEVIAAAMTRLNEYLAAHPDPTHYAGQLFLVEPHRIRIRNSHES